MLGKAMDNNFFHCHLIGRKDPHAVYPGGGTINTKPAKIYRLFGIRH